MSAVRENILNAAVKLFARRGYAGTTTREICAAAGISKPVLYYYFRDKRHLYEELMVDAFSYSRKKVLRASRVRGTLRERLIRMVHSELRAAKENRPCTELLLRMIFAREEDSPGIDFIQELEKDRDMIGAVMNEGVRNGDLKGNPRQLATVLLGMEYFAIQENLVTNRPTLTRRNAVFLVDILLQGCRRV
jgi:TetR/AcrR family transcriptional regulator